MKKIDTSMLINPRWKVEDKTKWIDPTKVPLSSSLISNLLKRISELQYIPATKRNHSIRI